MGFCTGMLVHGKALSNKYQRTKVFLGLNCTVGHTGTGFCNRANAWGENHLWIRHRKVFNLSGLNEPRILVSGESLRPQAGEYVNMTI